MLSFSKFLSEGKGPEQAKYHKGAEDEKDKRVKQFKRQAKMDDDDPKAYKDAPGDKEARKKGMRQSKHTTKYKALYGGDLKESEMHSNSLGKWVHKGPADYAEKLVGVFGEPDVVEKQDYGRVRSATWYHQDGFDSLMVEDENTTKYHPIPGVQVYVYGMKKLVVPKEMVEPLHKSSETIKIDQLKNEVTASCASTTICAVTLNFVMDCIAGKAQPTIQEYDKRVLSVVKDSKLDPDFEWWPDATTDIREKPLFEEKVPEHGLTRLGKNKGSIKRLVKKHLGAKAAEKITASDGEAIMKIAKEKDDEELRKRGSFIKNFYGESLLPSFSTYLTEGYGNKAIRKKAKETGISYSILKKVYDRGVAAWRTGHRPGTTPQQWGYARVNSFATGGKTRRTADKDLWKKHQANKKKKKNTKKEEVIMEAEYKGRKVKLNDPTRLPSGSKKKFKVYTTHPKTGNVIKVQFGDPGLSIKRDSDKRRKAFRARHGCDAVTYEDDRHTPKYWSCKMWEKDKKVSELD